MTIIVQSMGIPFGWVKLSSAYLFRGSSTRQAFSEHRRTIKRNHGCELQRIRAPWLQLAIGGVAMCGAGKRRNSFSRPTPPLSLIGPQAKAGSLIKGREKSLGVAVRKSWIQKAETVGRLIKIPNWRRPGLPAFVHLYSAAFLRGGRVRNELLAVAGTSQAFVVGSKSLNQCACRTRREEPAADWRNYQASNQRVSVGDRLCNSR
jgi:hypothetical protein